MLMVLVIRVAISLILLQQSLPWKSGHSIFRRSLGSTRQSAPLRCGSGVCASVLPVLRVLVLRGQKIRWINGQHIETRCEDAVVLNVTDHDCNSGWPECR